MIPNNSNLPLYKKGSGPSQNLNLSKELKTSSSNKQKIDSITAWLRQVEASSSTGAFEDVATLNKLGTIILPLESLSEDVLVRIMDLQGRCLNSHYDREITPCVKDVLRTVRPCSVSPVEDDL